MMPNAKTQQLIDVAVSLPVEERALIVESLLRSLNRPDSEMDEKWAEEANRRLSELRKGSEETVSGTEVFRKISKKLNK